MPNSSNNHSLHVRKENAFAAGLKSVYPIYVSTAQNSEIWDIAGKRYIDFGSGIAVTNVGHNNSQVKQALKKQLDQFVHTCFMVNPYLCGVELAERLNSLVPIESAKSLLVSTGAEAVENAIKIARAYTGKPGVIAFQNAFHGRTSTCLGLTWMNHYKEGFAPFPSYIYHAPFPSKKENISESFVLNQLDELIANNPTIGSVIIEPVQGEGGFNIASNSFLKALNAFCNRHQLLFIVDEIQTGFARTGKLFASEHYHIQPDLITLAKGIANGIPLAAVVGKSKVMDSAKSLGGTYGGNPLGCVAALKVLEIIQNEKLCERATKIGSIISNRLIHLKQMWPNIISDVRNLGAMIAIEFYLEEPNSHPNLIKNILQKAIDSGLILLSCGEHGQVIRIIPPLTIPLETLNEGLTILENSVHSACKAINQS